MIWLEKKYISFLSNQLDRFTWKRDDLANFRCPFCGDSEKNPRIARAFFYVKNGHYLFTCKNCGEGGSFKYRLKQIRPDLYNEFCIELLKESRGVKTSRTAAKIKKESPKPRTAPPEKSLSVRLKDLDEKHPAVRYARKRQFPDIAFDVLEYTEDFSRYASQFTDDLDRYPDDQRIVIPIKDSLGTLVGAQGRALSASAKIRYITAKLEGIEGLTFGADRVNPDELVYIVEGPFDSLFLPNAVAMIGTNLRQYPNAITVFDNEPRNREVLMRYESAIRAGHRVCIWKMPTSLKDVNDMVLSGLTPDQISHHIRSHSYSGLEASAHFSEWKKR